MKSKQIVVAILCDLVLLLSVEPTSISSQKISTASSNSSGCRAPFVGIGTLKLQNGTIVRPGKLIPFGSLVSLQCGRSVSESASRSLTSQCTIGGFFVPDVGDCMQQAVSVSRPQEKCGIQSANFSASGRILGGSHAKHGEFPWMARLNITYASQPGRPKVTKGCGGFLVSLQWVLTAAHCFTEPNKTATILVRLGRTNFTNNEKEGADEQAVTTSSYYLHPQFDSGNSYNYDYALIKLDPPVRLSTRVRTVCLPDDAGTCDASLNSSATLVDGCTEATVAGWGTTEDGYLFSPTLKKVNLNMYSRADCSAKTGKSVSEAQICAGRLEALQDSCLGDSGGPLMCQGASGAFTAIGVVSVGVACGLGDTPGIYSRVCKGLPWIRSVMDGSFFTSTTTSTSTSARTTSVTTTKRTTTTTTTTRPTTSATTQQVRIVNYCKIQAINYGQFVPSGIASFVEGQEVTLRCQDGFTLNSSDPNIDDDELGTTSVFECKLDGNWSPSMNAFKCVPVQDTTEEPDETTPAPTTEAPIRCSFDEIPDLANGAMVGSKNGGTGNVGDRFYYRCNFGFSLRTYGANFTECLATGSWSRLSVSCIATTKASTTRATTTPTTKTTSKTTSKTTTTDSTTPSDEIKCPRSDLPHLVNGGLVGTDELEPSGETAVGTQIVYQCNGGFVMQRTAVDWHIYSECLPNGTWSSLGFTCNIKSSSKSPMTTAVRTTSTSTTSTTEIVVVMATLPGDQVVTCSENQLPSISNGQLVPMTVSLLADGLYTVGSIFQITCNTFNGFKLAKRVSRTVSCLSSGQWTQLAVAASLVCENAQRASTIPTPVVRVMWTTAPSTAITGKITTKKMEQYQD